jgi:Ca-activated chloride channel homolog
MRSVGRVAAVVTLLVGLSLSAAVPTRGQDGRQIPLLDATAGTFKAAVNLVTLNVAVTDEKNRPVAGLARRDFEVFEDGVAQDLSFFAASEVPLDVALLVDASSSIIQQMPMIEQAASGFIDSLRPSDRAAVMSFASQLYVIQPFTSDHGALKVALRSIGARGSTALYTALYVALDRLERMRRESAAEAYSLRRQAVVVLTDGEDTASLIEFDDLLDRARRVGISIYPIIITADVTPAQPVTAKKYFNRADYAMRTLASETGARAFFPLQLTDLTGLYRLVAEELAMQYALGYVPKVERRDGSYRRIAVRIGSRIDARPRTRTGYYSPGPVRASREPASLPTR